MSDARKREVDQSQALARLCDLIEQAPDGIFVADVEGRYTDVNHAGCAMLGYTREELIGKTIAELIPDDDQQRLTESRQALLRGEGQRGEWLLRKKDGSWLPVEVSARILPDGRWQAFVRDIAERKEMERALRLSEEKFSGIVSISADAIVSMDEEHRITLFNEGAEKMFGYSKEEMIGAPLELLIPERFRPGHHRGVARFAAGEDTARRMGELGRPIYGRRKSGDEFPADAAISKLELNGTRIFTATLRDITELKRAEDEQRFLAEVGAILASSLDYEETLTSVAQLAVRDFADMCLVDIFDEGGEIRRLRTASRDPSLSWACELLTDSPIDRARPHLVREALETKRAVLFDNLSAEQLASFAQTDDRRRALDAVNPKSAIVVPLLARDQLLGAIGFVASASSRRYGLQDLQLAEALALRAALSIDNARLYRAAQRAINTRDEVLGVVAHDLRNPLTAILMQAQLFERRTKDPQGPPPRHMEAIRRSATRMNRMIQDLLDVTRLEAHHLTLDCANIDFAQVAKEAIEAQRPLAAAANLELKLELGSEVGELWGDADRLLQVFENLVGNAIKFTAAGGTVTVVAHRSADEVLVSVDDTGAGIAPDQLPHVFERFWQANAAEHRGAGLGLAIVKGIIEAHAGRIWVESEPGQGTSFRFSLPTTPAR